MKTLLLISLFMVSSCGKSRLSQTIEDTDKAIDDLYSKLFFHACATGYRTAIADIEEALKYKQIMIVDDKTLDRRINMLCKGI